jgi:DNA-binding winged helix-turn-helix (wHTH) protein
MSANVQQAGDPAATFRFGEFTFDCGSRLLTRSGVKRHLSLKAQQLLQLLLVARPRALSREDLYDALWPSTFVCETNLASIINEVRRALGDDARASNYIRTVHGFGYAFCGEVVSVVSMNSVAATLHCEGESHPLYEGENIVGRAQDCRVIIMAKTISRRHALITIHDGLLSIADLDSKNGTFVDGQLIGRLPVMVTPRTEIAFGSILASFNIRTISTTNSLMLNMPELKRQVAEKMSSV